jgi:hypothetical protein
MKRGNRSNFSLMKREADENSPLMEEGEQMKIPLL